MKGRALRKLNAIEITEGALLADVAVIFYLLARYTPLIGGFFRLPIFIVFAVLALRRGLYVGIMGLSVALFICSVMTGPQNVIFMFFEAAGGLFLGVTMKYRLRHIAILLVGVTFGALSFYAFLFLISLIFNIPLAESVQFFQHLYQIANTLINAITTRLGLALWWHQQIYPTVEAVAQWLFTYYLLTLYLVLWMILFPFVLVVYTVTNLFVRLLGYDVRPFPDGKLNRWLHRMGRRVVKIGIKRGVIRANS
jgi:hypothetical protein